MTNATEIKRFPAKGFAKSRTAETNNHAEVTGKFWQGGQAKRIYFDLPNTGRNEKVWIDLKDESIHMADRKEISLHYMGEENLQAVQNWLEIFRQTAE